MKKLLLSLLSRIDCQTAAEWRGIREARAAKPHGKAVQFAFAVHDKHGNERRFFCFAEPMDRPPLRSLNYALRMTELEMGVNRETLIQFIDALKEPLSGGKGAIDLGKVWQIVAALEERVNLAPFEEHLYWAAACEFFELSEDLEDFNFKEQEGKIAMWKQQGPADAFFLQPPLRDRLPLAGRLSVDLGKLLKMQELELRRQKSIFPFLTSE